LLAAHPAFKRKREIRTEWDYFRAISLILRSETADERTVTWERALCTRKLRVK